MKPVILALLVASLGQQPRPRGYEVTHDRHPPVRLDTVLTIQQVESQSAFQQLLRIGVVNHMPIGIAIGTESICRIPLPLDSGQRTAEDVIAVINASLAGYHAALRDGVLNIVPTDLPEDAAKLLNMRLPVFATGDNPHSIMGSSLWMNIRLVLAPDEGVVSGGMSSTMVERVPGFQATNQTVNSILNMIADGGSGGVWILHTSMVKNLSTARQRPYDIFGYVGQEQHVISDLKCFE